jgi:hypothetical protein
MKAGLLAPLFAVLATLACPAPPAHAEDTVRACIASSTSGQTLRKDGKLLAAREEMIACARDACPAIVRAHCARWLSEVDASIPSVVVRAQDASGADAIGAHLTIDGRTSKLDGQPVRLDPGTHTIAIANDHGGQKSESVLLVEGETSRIVTLRFPPPPGAAPAAEPAPPPAPPPPASRTERRVPTGAWVLGGAGVVVLGVATYFGVAAANQLSTLDGTCSPHCTNAATQTGRTDALAFDVSLGVGIAAVAGAVLWAVAFPSRETVPATARATARFDVKPVAGGAVAGVTFAY